MADAGALAMGKFDFAAECHACDQPIVADELIPCLFDEHGHQLCTPCFHRHFEKMAALESQVPPTPTAPSAIDASSASVSSAATSSSTTTATAAAAAPSSSFFDSLPPPSFPPPPPPPPPLAAAARTSLPPLPPRAPARTPLLTAPFCGDRYRHYNTFLHKEADNHLLDMGDGSFSDTSSDDFADLHGLQERDPFQVPVRDHDEEEDQDQDQDHHATACTAPFVNCKEPGSPSSPNTRFQRSLISDFYGVDTPWKDEFRSSSRSNEGRGRGGDSDTSGASASSGNTTTTTTTIITPKGKEDDDDDDDEEEKARGDINGDVNRQKGGEEASSHESDNEGGDNTSINSTHKDGDQDGDSDEKVGAASAQELHVPCHFCRDAGDLFCPECHVHMCSQHSRLHEQLWRSSRAAGSHVVVFASEQDTVLCEEHSRVQDLYCSDCEAMVCCLCMFGSHKSHEALPALQVVPHQREQMKTLVNNAKMAASNREVDLKKLDEAEADVRKNHFKAIRAIDSHFNHLRQILDARREQLLAQAGDEIAYQLETLSAERTQVVCAVASLRSSAEKANRLLAANDSLFVKGKPFSARQLEESLAQPHNAVPESYFGELPLSLPNSLEEAVAAHGKIGLVLEMQGDDLVWSNSALAAEATEFELGIVESDQDVSLADFVRLHRVEYKGKETRFSVAASSRFVARVRAFVCNAWGNWSAPVTGSRSFRCFEVGDELDALDPCGHWYRSEVKEVHKFLEKVLVHYINWDDRYDEWIPADSTRLARAGTHTTGPYKPQPLNFE